MQVIELKDRVIYRAEKGKKVKFTNNNSKFAEIVVSLDHKETIKIMEVDE